MTQQFRFACTIALLTCLASLPAVAAEPDFAACAKPVWPQGVQGAAPEGKLTLHFRVGADGSVLETKVSKSSGVALLDEAAQQGLTHCALAPSSERGAAGTWYPIKWSWTLDGAAGKWRLGDAPPAFADAPPEWRAFFQQTRQADAIADPLARCQAFPDMPGNKWPAGLAQSYCQLLFGKRLTLAQVAELVDSGALAKLDARYRSDLKRHSSKADFSEDIHLDINMFDDSDEAARVSEKWLAKAPASPFANTARAQHLLRMAWKARGAGWASETSQQRLERMSALSGQARDYFGTAVRMEPRMLPAYAGLINLAKLDGQDALGEAAFAHGVAVDPGCRYLSRDRMVALQPRWGGSEEAMQAYARQLAPLVAARPLLALSTILPAYDLGNVLYSQGKYAQAAAVLAQGLQVAPYPDMAGRQGLSMMQDGDYSWNTLVPLLVAYRYDVDDFGAARARGSVLLTLNDPEWALTSLRRAAVLRPGDDAVKYQLDKANRALTFVPLPIFGVSSVVQPVR